MSGWSEFEFESGDGKVTAENVADLLVIFRRCAGAYYGGEGKKIGCVATGQSKEGCHPMKFFYGDEDLPKIIGPTGDECKFATAVFTVHSGKNEYYARMSVDAPELPKKIMFWMETPQDNAFQAIPPALVDYAHKQGNGSTFKIVPVIPDQP